jgi:hypothetical protein
MLQHKTKTVCGLLNSAPLASDNPFVTVAWSVLYSAFHSDQEGSLELCDEGLNHGLRPVDAHILSVCYCLLACWLLTTGAWCPFAARITTEVKRKRNTVLDYVLAKML